MSSWQQTTWNRRGIGFWNGITIQGQGHPLEAVDSRKQGRIRRAAQAYLYMHHLPQDTPCRFDVVGILGETVLHVEDGFS